MPLADDVAAAIRHLSDKLGIEDSTRPEALESCAAFLALQHEGLDEADAIAAIGRMQTGGADDNRLDAVMVLINNQIVSPDADLDRFIDDEEGLDITSVRYIFVQATGRDPKGPGAQTLTGKLTSFITGMQMFYTLGADAEGINEQLREWLRFRDRLDQLVEKRGIGPVASLVSYLMWPRALSPNVRHHNEIESFRRVMHGVRRDHFEDIHLHVINDARFVRMFERLAEPRTCRIDTTGFLQTPSTDQVQLHLTGYPSAHTYLGWVTMPGEDGSPQLRTGIFQDNVRAYLGNDNHVNQSMRDTLQHPAARQEFHLRNNGVTIVARSCIRQDDGLTLTFPQIVNGCQTTHALFDVLSGLPEDAAREVRVPVRIVVSSDQRVVDGVVLGNNRQSPVDEFHILGRRPEVVRLATFFSLQFRAEGANRLSFERRARSFGQSPDEVRIVTIQDLAMAVSAMFRGQPHGLKRQTLLDEARGGRLFGSSEEPMFYYLAALGLVRLRHAYGGMWQRFGAKRQAQYALRLLLDRAAEVRMPPSRSGVQARTYLEKAAPVFLEPSRAVDLARQARSVIEVAEAKAVDESGDALVGTLSKRAAHKGFSIAVERAAANQRSS